MQPFSIQSCASFNSHTRSPTHTLEEAGHHSTLSSSSSSTSSAPHSSFLLFPLFPLFFPTLPPLLSSSFVTAPLSRLLTCTHHPLTLTLTSTLTFKQPSDSTLLPLLQKSNSLSSLIHSTLVLSFFFSFS